MGVLVDGAALKRAISIANTATSDTTDDNAGSGSIHGQFEQISSREVAINFSVGNAYVGTPNITLITPEKASAVNFMLLKINGHGSTSLRDLSVSDPMFIECFSVEEKLVDCKESVEGKHV